MATIVKSNRVQETWARTVAFTSANSDLVSDNILDVYNSLGKYGRKVTVITTAGSSITLRFNDRIVVYPMNQSGNLQVGEPDLQDPHTYTYTDVATWTVGASVSEVFELPVKEIRVTAVTVGSGITINCE